MSLDWIFNDITWCGDSKHCNITKCFRHFNNRKRKPQSAPDIYSMAFFQGTQDCPYYKSEKRGKDDF